MSNISESTETDSEDKHDTPQTEIQESEANDRFDRHTHSIHLTSCFFLYSVPSHEPSQVPKLFQSASTIPISPKTGKI